VKEKGMAAVLDTVLGRFFTARFRARGTAHLHSVAQTVLSLDPVGYAGCCAAVRDHDLLDALGSIAVPTTVVVGTHDLSTPPAMGRAIAERIPGAALVELDCAHIPHSEDPPAFVAMLVPTLAPERTQGEPVPGSHLASGALPAGAAPVTGVAADATLVEQYQRGIARRKQALGEAYVNARIEKADPFTADFQAMITRWAWQDVWTRPVFDDRTRRLVVLAITSALARWEEFRLHAKAGLDRELSPTELKELLQQAAIYAGVPTSVTGFKVASELLTERAAERAKQG
jgi:3-oxoadipate enol-lactonase/4-carboxymuconolactone decarboxylase